MNFRIGVGKHDITGPCAQIGFMGMSNDGQTGKGIHGRLFARAFIIDDPASIRLALVVADLAMCTLAVKAAVVRRLASDGNLRSNGAPLYADNNVLVAATHTHSGPGGYSHFLAYNASIYGFNKQNFDIIVEGIVESIRAAHRALRPGRILIARGEVADVGANRSLPAYERNPAAERALYPESVEGEMILLKFVDAEDKVLGTVNWCAVHPTNMGEENRLISGDNKGYAEELMEKYLSRDSGSGGGAEKPIAAFANSCCGDSSPNMKTGRPDGIHDLAHAFEYGQFQLEAARNLAGAAAAELSGPVSFLHRYVDMSRVSIAGTGNRTWPPAMGYGMINGSMEDSRGMGCDQWKEGTTKQNFRPGFCLKLEAIKAVSALAGVKWPRPEEYPDGFADGHAEKAILFPLGLAAYKGVPLAPSVLPLQILKIGSLVIASHPGEMTVMAGRRLKKALAAVFGPGAETIVIAAYANAYSSYTTTREEYAAQHYEGASTLFGPWTLDAYIQEDVRIAQALMAGVPLPAGAAPLEVSEKKLMKTAVYGWPDRTFGELRFGDVAGNVRPVCERGETVKVTFLGGFPNYDPRTGKTYLAVERKPAEGWPRNPEAVYTDADACTFFHWDLASGSSFLTADWAIPEREIPGVYRIRYFGSYKEGLMPRLRPVTGTSPEFQVR
jgi:neutral ceramidase